MMRARVGVAFSSGSEQGKESRWGSDGGEKREQQRRLREREASAWRRDAGDTAMAGGALAEAEGVADAAR
jgi:hypothetical protein